MEPLIRAPALLAAHPFLLAAVIVTAGLLMMLYRTGAASRQAHRRGVLVISTRHARRRSAAYRRAHPDALTLAGVAVPLADEGKHFKMIGTTGTGKSTAIRELLTGAIARGDRAIIADPDGGYLSHFHDRYRGDVILNPFEAASAKWDWLGEVASAYDVEQLATGLIPAADDPAAQEWRGYARTFLTAVARRLYQGRCSDAAELWRLLMVASPEELRPLLAGTPAQPFLDPDNARMFGSIRAVTGSAVAAFEHIRAQRTSLFSVKSWVRLRGNPGLLFLPYKASQIAALRTVIATWMRLAIFEAMSGNEGEDQRLWFVVDELDALGAIDGLKDALARLRKFGGRCILGFQAVAQVSATYGGGSANTIIENCGTTLILRCSGSENGGTSQFASRLIGEREVLRRQRSHGRDRGALFGSPAARRSTNVSEQTATETAVMASELEQLPDLAGYLKLVSSPAWIRVKVKRP
jgi:type IV secretory pathway TraG/TraD family ATPase VirD4